MGCNRSPHGVGGLGSHPDPGVRSRRVCLPSGSGGVVGGHGSKKQSRGSYIRDGTVRVTNISSFFEGVGVLF